MRFRTMTSLASVAVLPTKEQLAVIVHYERKINYQVLLQLFPQHA